MIGTIILPLLANMILKWPLGALIHKWLPTNTLLIQHLKSRCRAAHRGELAQIVLSPGGTICEEKTREDMIGTICEMARRTPTGRPWVPGFQGPPCEKT